MIVPVDAPSHAEMVTDAWRQLTSYTAGGEAAAPSGMAFLKVSPAWLSPSWSWSSKRASDPTALAGPGCLQCIGLPHFSALYCAPRAAPNMLTWWAMIR